MKHVASALVAVLGLCACAHVEPPKAVPPIANYGPNAVSVWNEIGLRAAGNVAAPDLATMHLAMYDAAMAIAGTHRPYAITPATSGTGLGEVGMNAALVEAAYRVLQGLFPAATAVYDGPHAAAMAALADGDDKARGRAIGSEVAAGMLAQRANDGRATVLPPYVPGMEPGQFRGVNPIGRIAPHVRPFVTQSHAQFRAPGPSALGGAAYAADFDEVRVVAAAASTVRTAAQTEVARFHTENPNLFWARNLRQFATSQPTLAENARLAAMIWAVYHDTIAACFDSKYHYNFWRPTSAIQLAATDGNAATAADPGWTPVVPTPNHPEYPAAHGCASGAVMQTVRDFYGSPKLSFEFTSTVTGTTHRYDSMDALISEITDARVWGGMHFRRSNGDGVELGRQVAKWMGAQHFRPVK